MTRARATCRRARRPTEQRDGARAREGGRQAPPRARSATRARVARAIDDELAASTARRATRASFDDSIACSLSRATGSRSGASPTEEINYRRFFDINDLAAMRMEDRASSTTRTRCSSTSSTKGSVTGLRLDHTDGLYDPAGVLRAAAARRDAASRAAAERGVYVVAEKILSRGEKLPRELARSTARPATTSSLRSNGLFVDAAAERAFDRALRARSPASAPTSREHVYDAQARDHARAAWPARSTCWRSALERHRRGATAARATSRCATLHQRDRETIAAFPVYRTYIAARRLAPAERRDASSSTRSRVAQARNPRRSTRRSSTSCDDVLLAARAVAEDEPRRREFAMRFQQLTGPVMAKGVEDTAFYRYNRLVCAQRGRRRPGALRHVASSEFHARNAASSRDVAAAR